MVSPAVKKALKEMKNAKDKEIKLIGSRAAQRIEKMVEIINERLKKNNASISPFIIDDQTKRKMTSNLIDHVVNWNPVHDTHNHQNGKTPYEIVRKFWNHKKAEKLGTHVFSPILSRLFQVL